MDKLIQKELNRKLTKILNKATEEVSKLEKEYKVKNSSFSAIHYKDKSIGWVTSAGYSIKEGGLKNG